MKRSGKDYMDNIKKPPLGVAPYWVPIEERIKELAEGIIRYNNENSIIYEDTIEAYAKEIYYYCEFLKKIKNEEQCKNEKRRFNLA